MRRALCHLLLTWLLLSWQLAMACAVPPAGVRAGGAGPMVCAEAAALPAHAAHVPAGQQLSQPAPALAAPSCMQLSHCPQCMATPPALPAGVALEPASWLPIAVPLPPAPATHTQRSPAASRAGPPVPDCPLFLRTARLRL